MTPPLEHLLRELGFEEIEGRSHDFLIDTLLVYGDVRTFVQKQDKIELPHYVAYLVSEQRCFTKSTKLDPVQIEALTEAGMATVHVVDLLSTMNKPSTLS